MVLGRLPTLVARVVPASLWRQPRRHAGHNKWSNIKHTKAAKDGERGRYISLIHVRMRGALSTGSPDPALNSQLRQLIEEAINNNIPKSTVMGMLKKLTTQQDGTKQELVELRGPGPCYVLLEVAARHFTMFISQIRAPMRRARFARADAKHAFEERAYVVTEVDGAVKEADSGGEMSDEQLVEKATDHAILAGAEEVVVDSNADGGRVLVFSSDWDSVYSVRKALVDQGYTVCSTDMVYEPLHTVQLQPADEQLYLTLMDQFRELPEILTITSNVELSSESAADQ